jgi:SIR2-like protein
VTTNYDDLLERAFAARPYHLVVHTTDEKYGEQILWREPGKSDFRRVSPKRLDFDPRAETVIYKMHGSVIYDPAGSDEYDEELAGQYVITEDDYVDFITRLTKGNALPAVLAEPFEKRHFLFLGYALRDWNFRVVLNRVQTKARRLRDIRSWAIDEAPSSIEQAFWRGRGVQIYRQAIDEFVENLQKARR